MQTSPLQFVDQATLRERDDHLRSVLSRPVDSQISPDELDAAGLALDRELFAVVVGGIIMDPPQARQDAEARLRSLGSDVRVLALGGVICLIANPMTLNPSRLARGVEAVAGAYPDVCAGVSNPRPAKNIDRCWREAVRTHALRSMLGNPRVCLASDAALLLALADMPSNWVERAGFHGANLSAVLGPVGSRDWDFMEAYLEERSLRKAASRVYLHHTSLDARLRRSSEDLGVDLTDSNVQFELLLMMRVRRVEVLLAQSQTLQLASC